MRRLILSLAALGSMAVVAGCNHTAGICDCDKSHNPMPPMGGHIAPVAATMPIGQAPVAPAVKGPVIIQDVPVPDGK